MPSFSWKFVYVWGEGNSKFWGNLWLHINIVERILSLFLIELFELIKFSLWCSTIKTHPPSSLKLMGILSVVFLLFIILVCIFLVNKSRLKNLVLHDLGVLLHVWCLVFVYQVQARRGKYCCWFIVPKVCVAVFFRSKIAWFWIHQRVGCCWF